MNQKKLFQEAEYRFNKLGSQLFSNSSNSSSNHIDQHNNNHTNTTNQTTITETEINKGRLETRTCTILPYINQYYHSKYLVKVESTINSSNPEISYHINSINKLTAKQALSIKRKHWSVEAFHYSKDVTFLEDKMKSRKSMAVNALMNSLMFNLFEKANFHNKAQAKRIHANSFSKISTLLGLKKLESRMQ